jgi:hypothetical protein
VFGVGRTKGYQLINDLPHIRVGGLLRVNRRTVQKELLDKVGFRRCKRSS